MRAIIAALPAIVLSCAAPTTCNRDPFQVDGRPMHPACVYELLCCLSDRRPVVASVDVAGCERSNRHFGGAVSERDGARWYEHSDLLGNGYFGYWYVGTTPRGVHVLETAYSGGGSGVLGDVIFVTLAQRTYLDHDKLEKRWTLSSIGKIVLGDRAGKKVSLDRDTLVMVSPDGKIRRVAVPDP